MQESERRIPTLDGIRAVLVVIVFTAHLMGTRYFPLARESLPMDHWAYMAMRVFFIISGFLITGILLHEINKRGRVDLVRFYFKRTFRIFPAYYAFLGVMGVAWLLGAIELKPGDYLHAVTYTSNYNPDVAWHLGHSWSLSVEEQFYMLWPVALLLTGVRRATVLLLSLMVLVPLWRITLLALPPDAFGLGLFQAGMNKTFDTTADVIAVGCLLAILRTRLWESPLYRHILQSRWMLAVLAVVIILPLTPEFASQQPGFARYALLTFHQGVGLTVVNVGIALLIDWGMRNPAGVIGRVLNHRIPIQVGLMSYSLYLWQQVFLNRHHPQLITTFPLNVVLACLCAWLSYRLVEMPFLALRDRLDARRQARLRQAAGAPQPATPLPAVQNAPVS